MLKEKKYIEGELSVECRHEENKYIEEENCQNFQAQIESVRS